MLTTLLGYVVLISRNTFLVDCSPVCYVKLFLRLNHASVDVISSNETRVLQFCGVKPTEVIKVLGK